MKFNIFIFGVLVGLICGFIAHQLDEKDMIEEGYIHNIFLGTIKVGNKN